MASSAHELVHVRVGVGEVPLPSSPNVVVPPDGSWPFQATFRTTTRSPCVVTVPFHTWSTRSPDERQLTLQDVAAAPARTVTSPWNPPGQKFTVR